MFTTIGIIVILFGLVMFFLYPHAKKAKEKGENVSMFLLMFKRPLSIAMIVLGLLIAMLNGLFFYAERGNQYLLVYPNGGTDAVMTPGIKLKLFAKIDTWQKYIDVKAVEEGQTGMLDEIEGVMKPIGIRFIDQVTAAGVVSIRFQLPVDKDSFIEMAIKFRSMENLVYNTLIPTVSEQLKNTGYMFAAQDYISGEAQSFRQTFEETLKGGTFVVNKIEDKDTLFSPITVKGTRSIKEIRTTYTVEKVLENGIPKRIKHEITENKIIVSQVIVDDINLEGAFKERLKKQRDESAKRQLEQQQTETAKSSQQRILAEGERDKSAEKVKQELEQVSVLIAKETQREEERTNKELAQIQYETAQINAKTIKVNAEAKRVQLQIADGLSEAEKYKIDKEVERSIGVAKAFSGADGLTLPQWYMGSGTNGSGKSSGSDMMSQIMMMMMSQQTMKSAGK